MSHAWLLANGCELDATCPPWCSGHSDKHNAWTKGSRLHVGDVALPGLKVGVRVVVEEREAEPLTEFLLPYVVVSAEGGEVELCPDDAVAVGAALMVGVANTRPSSTIVGGSLDSRSWL